MALVAAAAAPARSRRSRPRPELSGLERHVVRGRRLRVVVAPPLRARHTRSSSRSGRRWRRICGSRCRTAAARGAAERAVAGGRRRRRAGRRVSRRRSSAGCRPSWSDFWVLGHDPAVTWFVVGERDHQRLAVFVAHGRRSTRRRWPRRWGWLGRQGSIPIGWPARATIPTSGAAGAVSARSRLRRSSSSSVFGQSPFSRRDSPRSASSRPSVWQVGQ